MTIKHLFAALPLAAALSLSALTAQAQQAPAAPAAAAPAASAAAYVAPPWTYKTKQLSRNDVDKLVGNPKKLLVIDVRRPDEISKYGTLPVYLNVQINDLPDALDYIPRDRVIVTVSNRAHRAGAAGDLLTSKGFKVAGALGSEDYREAGGTIFKIPVPAPRTPAPAASAASN
jgi:rhodanese-related sulfurtransferase